MRDIEIQSFRAHLKMCVTFSFQWMFVAGDFFRPCNVAVDPVTTRRSQPNLLIHILIIPVGHHAAMCP